MATPEFKYKNPLTLKLGTGVSGSINGEEFTVREIQGRKTPKNAAATKPKTKECFMAAHPIFGRYYIQGGGSCGQRQYRRKYPRGQKNEPDANPFKLDGSRQRLTR